MTDPVTISDSLPEKTHMPETWRGETRALLALGIPMALTQLVQFFIYTVDIVMLGRVGATEVAAAALGSVIYFALWMLGSGPVSAVSPLISQALGADKHNYDDVRISVRMTLWAIALMFPVLLLVISLTEPMALMFGQDPEVAKKAGLYVLSISVAWPFALAVMVIRNFLAAIDKTRVPLLLVIFGTSINAGLNALLIFGLGPFPRLELVGAGLASSIAYAITFFMFVAYCNWDKDAKKFRLFDRFWQPDWSRFREVLRLGFPMSITTFFEGMLFNAAVILMGIISVTAQAAYQIGLNVVALAFMLPWGLSMAGAVRIGLAAGADNVPAMKRAAGVTLSAAVFGMALCALPVALYPDFIANLYMDASKPDSLEVVKMAAGFFPIAAAFMLFDASQVAANQLLRGLKDVNVPMGLTAISYWVIGFPIAYWLGLKTEVGPNGIWYGLMAGLIAASILLGGRLWWFLRKAG